VNVVEVCAFSRERINSNGSGFRTGEDAARSSVFLQGQVEVRGQGSRVIPPSSKPNEPDLTRIDTAARQVCNPDKRFVRQVFDLCRAQAPDCTVEEIAAGVEEKIAIGLLAS
jgi:hypothetical protein